MPKKKPNHPPLFSACVLAAALILAPSLRAQEDPASDRAKAMALEKDGRNTEAEQIWQSLAKVDPRNAEALAHLGLLEGRQEHYDAAIDYLNRAEAINPDLPGLQMNLGLTYFKASQFPDAIRIFSSEITKHPDEKRLTILLGISHFAIKDYLVALPYLKRGSEYDTQSVSLRVFRERGCLESRLYHCVLDAHKELLALDAESAEADLLAGEASYQMHDSADAAKQFRAAALQDPKHPNAHFALGYVLWEQGKWTEAASEFQLELQRDPGHAMAQVYLDDCRQQMNHDSSETHARPSPASLPQILDSLENPTP